MESEQGRSTSLQRHYKSNEPVSVSIGKRYAPADIDLPVHALLLANLRACAMRTDIEEVAGSQEPSVEKVGDLCFAIEGMFAGQADETRVPWNPFIGGRSAEEETGVGVSGIPEADDIAVFTHPARQ